MINFVLQALDGIFTIVFVVGIGYVLSKKGWFDDKSSNRYRHKLNKTLYGRGLGLFRQDD